MAVVGNAKERWEGRTSSFNGGTWSQGREWLVQTDSKTDREAVVGTATGLPTYGEVHPAPVNASMPTYAKEITYEPFEGPLAWLVKVQYHSARELNNDPVDDEILVSWTSEIYTEAIFEDTSGNAILNSAGDYFIDPTPTREASQLIAKIKANVLSVPTWVITAQNAVNNGPITIGGLVIATGLARIQRLDISERKKRGTIAFYELSFEVHIKREGWHLEPLDAGFRVLEGGVAVQARDDNQDEVTTPVPLNGSGGLLNPATPATAVFGDFTIYQEIDLTSLPGIT